MGRDRREAMVILREGKSIVERRDIIEEGKGDDERRREEMRHKEKIW